MPCECVNVIVCFCNVTIIGNSGMVLKTKPKELNCSGLHNAVAEYVGLCSFVLS